ncbi:hypothetical protein CO661_14040 [Sinorhizobium fredii]|uniref:Uncharacterized protein n=1 Tax=Rhizobium fredii TaxID=380 RepID=A0A2A6LY65_RHIFR|nr:hypothetical protein [Sinorhizobium fredii]PDT47298.1 hypothetical protein CO661_14040 [Sinorhizobium fredii]
MSSFTPGPWAVERDPNAGILKFGIYADDYPVVSHFTAIERESDARLIAAAPDLLAALKSAAAAIGDWSRPTGANGMTCARLSHPLMDAQREIYDVIAKAEGRS